MKSNFATLCFPEPTKAGYHVHMMKQRQCVFTLSPFFSHTIIIFPSTFTHFYAPQNEDHYAVKKNLQRIFESTNTGFHAVIEKRVKIDVFYEMMSVNPILEITRL